MNALRLAVLVDCPSLWHGVFSGGRGNLKPGSKLRVDYSALLKVLSKHGQPATVKAYIVSQRGVDVLGFKNALEEMGYQVVLVDKRTARESIYTDLMEMVMRDVDVVAVASDDPAIRTAVDFISQTLPVHWYGFNLKQPQVSRNVMGQPPHLHHHVLGGEVVL